VLVSITNFVVLQGLVLGKHPKAGADHPNILFLVKEEGELSFFGDKSLPPCSHDVPSPIWDFFRCGLDCDLKSKMLLSNVQESCLAVFANRRDTATYSLESRIA
jgi:hypothetical protein